MLPAKIDQPLTLIESQCAALAAAVENGDAQALETLGTGLRQLAVDFSALMEHVNGTDPVLRARLRKLSALLAGQRENLLRRSVVVERAVQVMLPEAQAATGPYSGPARRGSSAYRAVSSH